MGSPFNDAWTILKAIGYGTNYDIRYCPVCSENTYHSIKYDDVDRIISCDSCGLPTDDISMATTPEDIRDRLWELHNQ